MAQFDAAMMGVVVTFVDAGVLEMLNTGWWVHVETVDSSFKERTSDIDSDHRCSREYAARCLGTYGASKNTSAQHKRRGDIININNRK